MRRLTILLLATVSLAAQTRIRVDVELQQLTVTVTDANGVLVKGLESKDFTLEVDGAPQPVAHFSEDRETPVTFGIVIDRSRSMVDPVAEGLSGLRAASGLSRVLLRLAQPEDEFILMSFSDGFKVERNFTSTAGLIADALTKIKGGSGTNMSRALRDSLSQLKKGKHRKKALILVTDALVEGDPNALRDAVRSSQALVYTFAIQSLDPGGNDARGVMDVLANESGGRSELFDMQSERVIDQMVAFVREISDELRGQYTLGYYPSQTARFSTIVVKTASPNHQVRFRRGINIP